MNEKRKVKAKPDACEAINAQKPLRIPLPFEQAVAGLVAVKPTKKKAGK